MCLFITKKLLYFEMTLINEIAANPSEKLRQVSLKVFSTLIERGVLSVIFPHATLLINLHRYFYDFNLDDFCHH